MHYRDGLFYLASIDSPRQHAASRPIQLEDGWLNHRSIVESVTSIYLLYVKDTVRHPVYYLTNRVHVFSSAYARIQRVGYTSGCDRV